MVSVFEDLRAGDLKAGEAKELSNAAGKIIASVKVQCEYAKLRQEKPQIDFMTSSDKS